MPNDNIERAIKSSEAGGGAMEHIIYEAYDPVAVRRSLKLTDNRNKEARSEAYSFRPRLEHRHRLGKWALKTVLRTAVRSEPNHHHSPPKKMVLSS